MVSLLRTLQDTEPALLPILATQWGIKIDMRDRESAVKQLAEAMLDRARAEAAWERLDDAHRGALQVLISNQSRMPETMFTRLFGEIRRMGAGQIEKERPHERPTGTAEALYYRGLLALAYENTNAGARAIVYIPEDLLAVLPVRRTAYDQLDEEPDEAFDEDDEPIQLVPIAQPHRIQPADTSVVDDLTTLLAFIQLYAPSLEGDTILEAADLVPHLLNGGEERLVFMLGLCVSANFVETQAARLYIKRPEVRRWLDAPRSEQIRSLAEAWRGSEVFHDLWHVPGLTVEREAGTMPQYSPAAARSAFLDLLQTAIPRDGWWPREGVVDAMRLHDHDFQRPSGDYQSWYIRDEDGEYLTGEESWDAVDGELLRYYMTGPLHWLGLLDLGDDAARLTAYGRAFAAESSWPTPPEPQEKLSIQQDGTLQISRKASRMDRFQVARFSSWISAGDPYMYRIDGSSVERARQQGIETEQISNFLLKASGENALPASITRLLENWRGGAAASVIFERVVVVRASSSETIDYIFDTPAFRRFLGARLGPTAVIIRADQWDALQNVLGEHGITVERIGL